MLRLAALPQSRPTGCCATERMLSVEAVKGPAFILKAAGGLTHLGHKQRFIQVSITFMLRQPIDRTLQQVKRRTTHTLPTFNGRGSI